MKPAVRVDRVRWIRHREEVMEGTEVSRSDNSPTVHTGPVQPGVHISGREQADTESHGCGDDVRRSPTTDRWRNRSAVKVECCIGDESLGNQQSGVWEVCRALGAEFGGTV